MMQVTVNKFALLSRVKENRAVHTELFEKAWEGYRKAAHKELATLLRDLKNGKPIARFLVNVPPEDHTSDYDTVIDMLEMSVDTEFTLAQAQFQQYVRDDWGWKEQWTTSNSAYLGEQ